MRIFLSVFTILFILGACVPAKKYNDLLEKSEICQDELKKYKTVALDSEASLKTAKSKLELLESAVDELKKDTTDLGNKYRSLQAKYQHAIDNSASFEEQLQRIKDSDAKDLREIRADLESKIIEAQRKEDELMALEKELKAKEIKIAEREERINELEEMIARKDEAVQKLKDKIATSLYGYRDKGLTVEERNGKIYVSLEAKLLFASGSTEVSQRGAETVTELAKAIQFEEDLEIIVEGHTDTDQMRSSSHPKDNWELSVLRATAVVEIMTNNSEINPGILSASGRSEYHPVDPNDKSKNRRIEVIISPNLDELFEVIGK